MPSEQKRINNWKARRRKTEDNSFLYIKSKGCQFNFFFLSLYFHHYVHATGVLFIWIWKIFSSLDPLPFSQDIWISFWEKGRRKYKSAFPQVPFPHPKDLWIKRRKGLSWVLLFGCLRDSDWKLGSHENEKSFFWWVILCVSHCWVWSFLFFHVLFLGAVFIGGDFPPACPLGESVAAFLHKGLSLSLSRLCPAALGPWGQALWGASHGVGVSGCVWPGSFGGPVGASLSFQPLAVTFSLQIQVWWGCCFWSSMKLKARYLLLAMWPCLSYSNSHFSPNYSLQDHQAVLRQQLWVLLKDSVITKGLNLLLMSNFHIEQLLPPLLLFILCQG